MKRCHAGMQRWMRMSLVLGVIAAGACAAVAQEVPFEGVVVEDKVSVRAGAGRAYYVVGELSRGEKVQVNEVIFGWNKIDAPAGVFSYISKAFVDAQGDGKTGVVNTDRTEVYAASVKGPGESYLGQVFLNRGDTVRIVGEDGSYYRIMPPARAYVFLPPGSVRRASALQEQQADESEAPSAAPEPAAAAQEPAESPAVAAEPEPAPEAPAPAAVEPVTAAAAPPDAAQAAVLPDLVPSEASEQTASPQEAQAQAQPPATQPVEAAQAADGSPTISTPAISEALRAVELENLPLFLKPLEEQPIDQMIAQYEAVAAEAQLSRFDQRIVEQRLAALRRNRELAQMLRQIAQARQEVEQTQQQEAAQAQRRAQEPARYDVIGKLLASSLYDGQNLPRMYRLVDPATGRTLGYVQPGGPLSTRAALGQLVGIVGKASYDSALKLRVFQIERIDVLDADASTPAPQQP